MKSTEIIQPTPISAPIAHDGLKFNIPENATGSELASIAEGFPEITMKALDNGGLPPRGQDCNGMFYLSTDQKVYLQNGGIITFNQAVSDLIGGYPQGAYLDYIDTDGNYFKVKSLIDDNNYNFVTNSEYINGEKWELINFGGANVSLTNLTPEGEKHFLNKTQISSCILEAPQMVDLQLDGNVLKLKGKAIIPYGTEAPTMAIGDTFLNGTIADISYDGSKLFYIVEYENLEMSDVGSGTGQFFVFIVPNGRLGYVGTTNIEAGTQPESSTKAWYYNTATNFVSNSSDSYSYASFPLAICTRANNVATGIVQVFQHTGYLNSVVWCTKGLKALLPNGRNADGSLKNIQVVTENILVGGGFKTTASEVEVRLNYNNDGTLTLPRNTVNAQYGYNFEKNIYYRPDGLMPNSTPLAVMSSNTDGIQTFAPVQDFMAVDYNIYERFINTPFVTTKQVKLAKNGFLKLNNGIIFQWGTATLPANTQEMTVTLPTPFTNAEYSVTITHIGLGSYIYTVPTGGRTTTSFKMYQTGKVSNTMAQMWFAIGY